MFREIRQAIAFTAVTMVLFGGVYHAVFWVIGHAVFPRQAAGSLIHRSDGTIVGSSLIAQNFTRPEYFHPRPSAVDYNAASTGGSNYGPSNPEHLKVVEARIAAIEEEDGVARRGAFRPKWSRPAAAAWIRIFPPNAADLQAPRVARSRGVDLSRVQALVAAHTEGPTFGFLGRPRVNVLELNLALDEALGAPRAPAQEANGK